MVDLSKYTQKILVEEDRPLFDEAVRVAKAGGLRAAYVMIWLACAESLKRRFVEAQLRDNNAGNIVQKVDRMEEQHMAVDKFLLDEAHKFGFLSDSGHTSLSHIYKMRCIYSHPYEEAPSPEKVADAASTVVERVLSKPVKLRHGYGQQLLSSLLEDTNFLDDHEPSVVTFATHIIRRLDEDIYIWFIDKYLSSSESLIDDASMAVFARRSNWFLRTMIEEIGVSAFSSDDWHERVTRYPKSLTRICGTADIFNGIGKLAQDSLVGLILEQSRTQASILIYLEELHDACALSKRHRQRFKKHISNMDIESIKSSGLSTCSLYARLIKALMSYNWYVQNPAIDILVSNGPKQVIGLTERKKVNLGRNILQAGEGKSSSAIDFIVKLSKEPTCWPFDIVRGIILESFVNEDNEIRLKSHLIGSVFTILDNIDSSKRNGLMDEIVSAINVGTVRHRIQRDKYDKVDSTLGLYIWAAKLARALEAKFQVTQTSL